jgi:hypothetical protein
MPLSASNLRPSNENVGDRSSRPSIGVLDRTPPIVVRLARSVVLCPGGYGHPLATRTVSEILGAAVQIVWSSSGPAGYRGRGSAIDRTNGARHSFVACTADSRRLKMLGISISERTVSRILRRLPRPPSQTWKTFLHNHLGQMVSIDFFTVPTITMKVRFVFIILEHGRRQVLHFNVTEHPTAAWTPTDRGGLRRLRYAEVSYSRPGCRLRH